MKQVTVLGGAGAVGSVAAKTLAGTPDFDRVVVADMNLASAEKVCAAMPSGKGVPMAVDAMDPASLLRSFEGSQVVLNCVGPFYKSVKTVLGTVLDAGIDYVDVCDDVDVTLEILDWDARAKARGVTAVIGMGNSPGATNLLAKYAADALLDEVTAVDIFHAHGGEPVEGAGVIGHRFHCMSIDVPMFLDGKLKYVKFFGPDGIALRQTFDFPILGEGIPVYPYPHPEQVTLPRYIKLSQVTNKGTVLPNEYYDLTRDMCALGLASREPVMVDGQEVAPYDFAVAYILKKREEILKATDFGTQRGCCSVVASGKKDGKYMEYRFHMASQSQALGEGTGIPAAGGTLLLARGRISQKGVFPPEGCINPADFITLIPEIMTLDGKKEGGSSFGGIIIQQKDENGNITNLEM
ncbi:MAG: saccharopine dehydrogenase NADP-binding domain-containing protein [Proteobacteria bacterium]|nr:saccharopine dehydrogenase NADP-binding domain-containing protein [Pseudomonadota bacterium]